MIVTNEKTGEDITGLFVELMEGKITHQEFWEITGLEPSEGNPHRKEWEEWRAKQDEYRKSFDNMMGNPMEQLDKLTEIQNRFN